MNDVCTSNRRMTFYHLFNNENKKDINTMKVIITNLIKREIGQKYCFYKTSILHNNNKYRHINQKKKKKKVNKNYFPNTLLI